jgi:hypothetical protein
MTCDALPKQETIPRENVPLLMRANNLPKAAIIIAAANNAVVTELEGVDMSHLFDGTSYIGMAAGTSDLIWIQCQSTFEVKSPESADAVDNLSGGWFFCNRLLLLYLENYS